MSRPLGSGHRWGWGSELPGRGCPARGGCASADPSEPPTFSQSWYRDAAGIGDVPASTHQTPEGCKSIREGSRASGPGAGGPARRWQGQERPGRSPCPGRASRAGSRDVKTPPTILVTEISESMGDLLGFALAFLTLPASGLTSCHFPRWKY